MNSSGCWHLVSGTNNQYRVKIPKMFDGRSLTSCNFAIVSTSGKFLKCRLEGG